MRVAPARAAGNGVEVLEGGVVGSEVGECFSFLFKMGIKKKCLYPGGNDPMERGGKKN